jgi:hypothetical protein
LTSEVESTSQPESGSDVPTTGNTEAAGSGGASHSDEQGATSATEPPAPAPAPPATVSKWRRFFLLEAELRAAEARAFLPGQPGFAEFALAREALEAAQALLDVPERRDAGLLLLRDAMRLAMTARLLRHELPTSSDDSIRALERIEPELFSAGGDEADLEIVRRAYGGDESSTAHLTAAERLTWTRVLGSFVPRAVDALQREAELAALVRGRRTLRVGTAVTLLALVVGVIVAAATLATRRTNVALHRPVVVSSIYDNKRFPASGIVDGDLTKIGCHTKSEHNPWIRIDLAAPTEIHEVVVYNRTDFADRAVPLVIEVSNDGRTYQPFARRGDVFSVWHAKGTPVVGRYVRLTIAKTSALHFNEVQVF